MEFILVNQEICLILRTVPPEGAIPTGTGIPHNGPLWLFPRVGDGVPLPEDLERLHARHTPVTAHLDAPDVTLSERPVDWIDSEAQDFSQLSRRDEFREVNQCGFPRSIGGAFEVFIEMVGQCALQWQARST